MSSRRSTRARAVEDIDRNEPKLCELVMTHIETTERLTLVAPTVAYALLLLLLLLLLLWTSLENICGDYSL